MNTNLANKHWIHRTLYALTNVPISEMSQHLQEIYRTDACWRGSHPLNELNGVENIVDQVWKPLLHSFPDLERRDTIVVAGEYESRHMVACLGHYFGTFRNDWLGIPATGHPVYLRYGEVHEIEDGKIHRSSNLWDVLDVIRQAGFWPLAPSTGVEGMWPSPLTGDGLVMYDTDPEQSAASLAQTLAMHKSLADYDDTSNQGRDGLLAMPQKEYWHPKMMWYGPSGIGTTRGLQGFVDYHQLPFRIAFPNRRAGATLDGSAGKGHYIRIGDGNYSVTGGWPSVVAKHSGRNFLGVGATGRDVEMRVMDFYLHHEGLIRENWVPIDIIHLLKQMDVDVFERMQQFFRRGVVPDR